MLDLFPQEKLCGLKLIFLLNLLKAMQLLRHPFKAGV